MQFAESGKEDVTVRTLSRIAEALELPLSETMCDDTSLENDQFKLLPWSISRFIQLRTQPCVDSFCQTEDAARGVILKMRESWRTHLDNTGPAENGDHFRAADEKLNRELDEYVERYLALWRRCPDVLQVATGDGIQYGASVVLPITDEAFERLESGEISFMEIGPQDLQDQSQNLVLDSVVEFAGTGHPAWHKFTSTLSYVVFCQIATLSFSPTCDNFRMISFSASPLNYQRLQSIGFEANGVTMPDYDYSVCVFSTQEPQSFDEKYVRASTTAHFSHLLQGLYSVGSSFLDRRVMVKRTLAVLHKFAKRPSTRFSTRFRSGRGSGDGRMPMTG